MADPDNERRERVLNDFLQGGPRSDEWRLWRDTLDRRLSDMKHERADLLPSEERDHLDRLIKETEAQIDALTTEEIISEFVESEIVLTLNSAEPENEWDTYDYSTDGQEE